MGVTLAGVVFVEILWITIIYFRTY